jgi:hypothetical protein
MDVTAAHLEAGLRLAIDGNRRLGAQLRTPIGERSHAAFDSEFMEEGWPEHPGRQPQSIAARLIIAATSSATDLARLLMHLPEGGGILTAELLCRHTLEAAATGTWILSPGLVYLDEPLPEADPESFAERTRRERIERAHLIRWLSMTYYDDGQSKDKKRRARIAEWKRALGGRVSECEPVEGEQTKHRLDGTTQAGLARMATELEKRTFGPPKERPRIYSHLSAYAHPNVDSIVEMEGPDGHWQRDAADMVHLLWIALAITSRAWEELDSYAGWDTAEPLAWRTELEEINLFRPATADG